MNKVDGHVKSKLRASAMFGELLKALEFDRATDLRNAAAIDLIRTRYLCGRQEWQPLDLQTPSVHP